MRITGNDQIGRGRDRTGQHLIIIRISDNYWCNRTRFNQDHGTFVLRDQVLCRVPQGHEGLAEFRAMQHIKKFINEGVTAE